MAYQDDSFESFVKKQKPVDPPDDSFESFARRQEPQPKVKGPIGPAQRELHTGAPGQDSYNLAPPVKPPTRREQQAYQSNVGDANAAAKAIRDIEAKKAEAVRLFQQVDKTPADLAGTSYTPGRNLPIPLLGSDNKPILERDRLRARAEGALEAANELARRAQANSRIEVGFSKDSDPTSSRQWAYAKPKNALTHIAKKQQELKAKAIAPTDEQRLKGKGVARLLSEPSPEVRGLTTDEAARSKSSADIPEVGSLRQAANAYGQSASEMLAGTPYGIAKFGETLADKLRYGGGTLQDQDGTVSGMLRRPTDEATANIRASLPTNPNDRSWMTSKIPQALGSMTGFAALGGVGGAVGATPSVIAGLGGIGAEVSSFLEEAKQAGIDPSRVQNGILMAGVTGMTEMFGLGRMLDKFGVKRPVLEKALDFLEEGGQEALQGYMEDVNAKLIAAHDPNRNINPNSVDFWTKRGEEAALGLIAAGPIAGADIAIEQIGKRMEQKQAATGKATAPTATPAPFGFRPTNKQPTSVIPLGAPRSPQATQTAATQADFSKRMAELPESDRATLEFQTAIAEAQKIPDPVRRAQAIANIRVQADATELLGVDRGTPIQDRLAQTGINRPGPNLSDIRAENLDFVPPGRQPQIDAFNKEIEREGQFKAKEEKLNRLNADLEFQGQKRAREIENQKLAETLRALQEADKANRQRAKEGPRAPVAPAAPPSSPLMESITNPEGGVPFAPEIKASPGAMFERVPFTEDQEDIPDVLKTIRKYGGVRDDGIHTGEIRNLLGNKETGTSGLINKNGLSPDRMREALVEDGLLSPDSTVADFFDLINNSRSRRTGQAQTPQTIDEYYSNLPETPAFGAQRGPKSRTGVPIPGRKAIVEPIQAEAAPEPAQPMSRYKQLQRAAETTFPDFWDAPVTAERRKALLEYGSEYDVDNLISEAQNYQVKEARRQDAIQKAGKSAFEKENAAADAEDRLEIEVLKLGNFFNDLESDPDLADEFDKAIRGENSAEFAKALDQMYGISEETTNELIEGRRSAEYERFAKEHESTAEETTTRSTRDNAVNAPAPAEPTLSNEERGKLDKLLAFDPTGLTPANIDKYIGALDNWSNRRITKGGVPEEAIKQIIDRQKQAKVIRKEMNKRGEIGPMYPSRTLTKAQVEEKLQKERDKKAAEATPEVAKPAESAQAKEPWQMTKDDLIAEIKKISPRERETSPYFQEYEKRGLNKIGASSSSAPKEESEPLGDLGGYEKNLPIPIAAKAVAQMNTARSINGTFQTRKQFVEDSVRNGATVERREGQRAIVQQSGNYMLERDITKTAIDYAEYLIGSQKKSEVAKPSPAETPPPAVSEETKPIAGETYWKGDKARYTGNMDESPGQDPLYELEILEGTRKGEKVFTAKTPEGYNPNADRSKREWRKQQEEFKQLKKPPIAEAIRSAVPKNSDTASVKDLREKGYSDDEIIQAVKDSNYEFRLSRDNRSEAAIKASGGKGLDGEPLLVMDGEYYVPSITVVKDSSPEAAPAQAPETASVPGGEITKTEQKILDLLDPAKSPKGAAYQWLSSRTGKGFDDALKSLVDSGKVREVGSQYYRADAPATKVEAKSNARKEIKALTPERNKEYERRMMAGQTHEEAIEGAKETATNLVPAIPRPRMGDTVKWMAAGREAISTVEKVTADDKVVVEYFGPKVIPIAELTSVEMSRVNKERDERDASLKKTAETSQPKQPAISKDSEQIVLAAKNAMAQYSNGRAFDPWDLAGDANKRSRQAVMSVLLGRKATISESGVTAITQKFAELLGVRANGREIGEALANLGNEEKNEQPIEKPAEQKAAVEKPVAAAAEPRDTSNIKFVVGTADDIKSARVDHEFAISQGQSYFTLWTRRRRNDGWTQWNYISILPKSETDAIRAADAAMRDIASGKGRKIAFMGDNETDLRGQSFGLVTEKMRPEDLADRAVVDIGEQPLSMGRKYPNVLVKDLWTEDPKYTLWAADNLSGSERARKISRYLQSRPEYKETIAENIENAAGILTQENIDLAKTFGINISEDQGRIILGGKTYDWKEYIKQAGGRFNEGNWTLDPAQATSLLDRLRGLPIPSERAERSRADEVANPKFRELRRDIESRPDRSGIDKPVSELVSPDTQSLLKRGTAAGMPESVISEQIEDVAKIRQAYERKGGMFLLASEPGSGKTFVLGAAIRELRAAGAKKITYVTLRKELIDQIKADLKDYGIGDVQFVTYPEMRKAGSRSSDVLIFDEAHSVKNVETGDAGAQQAKAAAGWISRSKMTIFSTATPFENPVQAAYLEPTGIFEPFGGHWMFAQAYGAKVIKIHTPKGNIEVLKWDRDTMSVANAKAARDYFIKEGVFTSRPIQLPPGKVDARMSKVSASDESVRMYDALSSAAEQHEDMLSGFGGAWVVNLQKRILEAAKVERGITEAKSALDRGRFPIIFVETKAERKIDIPDILEREKEYERAKAAAAQMHDTPPKRASFGLPPSGVSNVLRSYMDATGDALIEIPSAEEVIAKAIGKENVAIFTGSVTPKKAQENLDSWRRGEKKLIVATMAKGGTGLSLHDKVGDHPTTQIVINLPWTATQVKQVAQRNARYGLQSGAEINWIFADNIPFDRTLAAKVGGRMADMGASVYGDTVEDAAKLRDWDIESQTFSEINQDTKEAQPETAKQEVKEKNEQPIEKPTEQKAAVEKADSGSGERLSVTPEATGRTVAGRKGNLAIPRVKGGHDITYEVRELADVQPSHNPFNFQPNDKYRLKNDRDYTAAANRMDVESATAPGEFNPELVINTDPTATNGPPVIHSDGTVLGGNSRTMMIARIYRNKADADAYRETLKNQAATFGIKPAELDRFNQPILVRVLATDNQSLQKLITDLNIQPGKAMSSTEAAIARSKELPPETADFISRRLAEEGPDGTLAEALTGHKGVAVLNRLIEDGVIPAGDRNRYLSDQGNLSASAKDEIEQLVLGRLFADAAQMKRVPPIIKNKLVRVAPHLAKMAGSEWDITPLMPQAIDAVMESINRKQDIDMLSRQNNLLASGPSYSEDELTIAKAIKDLGPRQIENKFRRYAADYEAFQQGQTLFGSPPSQSEAFADAFGNKSNREGALFSVRAPKPPTYKPLPAPVFFSAAERFVQNSKFPEKGSGAQMLATIMNPQSGVKADEVKWLGLEDWLRPKQSVTRQELLDFIRANEVQIEEVEKGRPLTSENNEVMRKADRALRNAEQRLYNDLVDNRDFDLISAKDYIYRIKDDQSRDGYFLTAEEEDRIGDGVSKVYELAERVYDANQFVKSLEKTHPDTKHLQWVEPGAKEGSYRELLLTMPASVNDKEGFNRFVNEQYAGIPFADIQRDDPALAKKLEQSYAKKSAFYNKNHFDEANILAHIRFNERTDADGKRTMFVEEIQSDWAQKGRQEGFKENKIPEGRVFERDGYWRVQGAYDPSLKWKSRAEAEAYYLKTSNPRGVPAMPFPKTESWAMLAFKRVLRHAAENGYDQVAWTTGEQQAKRYDLSKQVKEIEYIKHGDQYELGVTAINGDGVKLPKDRFTADELEDVVGKEIAQKIVNGEGRKYRGHDGYTLEGLDLKIGGEGMKGFYDAILPSAVNKYIKKWGGKVGEAKIETDKPRWYISPPDQTITGEWRVKDGNDPDSQGFFFKTEEEAKQALSEKVKKATVHAIDITPAMKESVLQGQPLFAVEAGKPKRQIINPWRTPKAEKPTDIQGQAAIGSNIRAQFRQRKGGRQGVAWVNEQATIAIGSAMQRAGIPMPDGPQFEGLSTPLENAQIAVDGLRERAEFYRGMTLLKDAEREASAKEFENLADRLEEAMIDARANGAIAIAIVDATAPYAARIAREELFHNWQRKASAMSSGDAIIRRMPKATQDVYRDKIKPVLAKEGYKEFADDDIARSNSREYVLVTEAAAKMASGQAANYNVSIDEAAEFMDGYFHTVARMFGPEAFKNIDGINYAAKQVLQNVEGRAGIDSSAISEGRSGGVRPSTESAGRTARADGQLAAIGKRLSTGSEVARPASGERNAEKAAPAGGGRERGKGKPETGGGRGGLTPPTTATATGESPKIALKRLSPKIRDMVQSPLSNLNYVGTYEKIAGKTGKQISEAFRATQERIAKDQTTRTEAVRDLRKEIKPLQDEIREAGGYGLAKWIDDHIDAIEHQDDVFGGLARFLKRSQYVLKLQYNPRGTLLNVLQPLQTLWPHLTTKEFAQIVRQAYTPSVRARLADIAAAESGGKIEGMDENKSRKWYNPLRYDMFSWASNNNRIMGHLAGEMMADRLGLTGEAKDRLAADWAQKTEFDNSAFNIPPLFRGNIASILGQFRPYTVKNIERIIADSKRGVQGSKVGTKARIAKMVVTQIGLGGLRSIPGVSAIGGIVVLGYLAKAFSAAGMDDDDANKAAEAVYFGSPALVDQDLSMSMTILDAPFGNTPSEKIVNTLGPTVSTVAAIWKEFGYMQDVYNKEETGREKTTKEEKYQRSAVRLAKRITPYTKTALAGIAAAQGKTPTIFTGKEEPMTKTEAVGYGLMGAPVRQSRYWEEKEAWDWQKKLAGIKPEEKAAVKEDSVYKPKRLPNEPDETYKMRSDRAQGWLEDYGRQVEEFPRFKALSDEDKEWVRDSLRRRISQKVNDSRPNLKSLRPAVILMSLQEHKAKQPMRDRRKIYVESEK